MNTIRIKDVMTRNPRMIKPSQTVKEAARMMKEEDVGVLPVGSPEKVLGVITDRDIAVRVTAEGEDPSRVKVEEAMTGGHIVCNEDDDIERAADLMRKNNVSRVLVADGGKVTGIATIADLLRNRDNRQESDKVLHHLLGRKAPQRKPKMGTAGAGSESCDTYDEAI